jgi:hypothetical protein
LSNAFSSIFFALVTTTIRLRMMVAVACFGMNNNLDPVSAALGRLLHDDTLSL